MNTIFVFVLLSMLVVAFAGLDRTKIVESFTREELLDVLKTNGYAAEPIESKENLVRLTISGMKGTLIISKSSLQFYAAARSESPEIMARVNKWNQEKRYSRSYLDKDNDPILELDLDMSGGVTLGRVEDFLSTVTKSLLAWMVSLST